MIRRHFHLLCATRASVAVAVVLASCFLPSVQPTSDAEGPAKQPAARAEREPEEVLFDFIIAALAGDADTLERLAVPHPDLIILAQGDRAPDKALSAFRALLPKSFSRLKIGDKVEVPGGGTVVIDETHVNKDRIEITTPYEPNIPFILIREDGVWKVEPDPIIAARLAAKQNRNHAAEGKWPQWSPDKKTLELLDAESEHGRIRLRLPLGYIQLAGGDSVLRQPQIWQSPAREDMTQANLSVSITKLSEDLATWDLDKLLSASLSSVAKRRDRFRLGVVGHGVVSGRKFARARWTCVSKPTRRPEYSGRPMRGFAYGTVADGAFVLLMSQDLAVHARGSLPVTEASVLMVRIK